MTHNSSCSKGILNRTTNVLNVLHVAPNKLDFFMRVLKSKVREGKMLQIRASNVALKELNMIMELFN